MQENSKEYAMYKSFDELPVELKEKFKNGAKGGSFARAKYGYVDFINQLKRRGDGLVGCYVGNDVKTQVRLFKCGHVVDISPNNYKRGRGCGICNGRQIQHGINDLTTTNPSIAKEWHPTKNGELTPHDVGQGSNKKLWWKCREHGHEWEATIISRVEGRGCPFCSNRKVLKGYNDLATTHPTYVRYFTNTNDIYGHTSGSDKKVELQCPECGYSKIMRIDKLTRYGFSCDICSDGISYSEKIMASVLTKLNINFTKQMSYDNGKHKYDFYLPKYNTILETHGLQHYEQSNRGRSLEEEQENDRYKRELAVKNGVANEDYHEVDCRYSTLEWCRHNIEKTLGKYIDMSILTDEDWKQADIQSQKSLKIETCKYWEEHRKGNDILTVAHVAKVFEVHSGTIRRYLKWGNTNGFCTYNGEEEKDAIHARLSTFVYLIKPSGEQWFDKPMSMSELSKQTGISQGTIRSNLDGGALEYHFNSKYPKEYIGSHIISAEVYDSQHQTNQNT